MSFSIQYFYATKEELSAGCLSEEESHHCAKVLRKRVGDRIHALDGEGGVYLLEIIEIKGKTVAVKVLSSEQFENDLPELYLAVAPTKNLDRYEFFIEKAIEIGVKEITPILCGNSERKHLNVEKLRKRAIAACKQSGTRFFPQINEFCKMVDFKEGGVRQKLVAHCYSQETPHLVNLDLRQPSVVLIGPEGDFTEEEVALLKKRGYSDITLGEKRLRTETAAIFVAACFNLSGSPK